VAADDHQVPRRVTDEDVVEQSMSESQRHLHQGIPLANLVPCELAVPNPILA
jgi:hypothetical protein